MGEAAMIKGEHIPRPPYAQELKEELINKPSKKVKKIYESRGIEMLIKRIGSLLRS